MDDPGDSGKTFSLLVLALCLPSSPDTSISNWAFLLFPDGFNFTSMNGEAQDQSEAEVKDSMSLKKAIATLKVTGCWAEGILFGFWTLGCH